jgi:hypothetical protein
MSQPTQSMVFAERIGSIGRIEFFHGRPRIETFHAIALAAELSGFAFGWDRPFGKMFEEVIITCLGEASCDIYQSTEEYGDRQSRMARVIAADTRILLVREKADASMQTEPLPREDKEAQIPENPAAPKGKPKTK